MKIEVNQITLNYEVFGSGEALICLHGNREDLTIYDKLSEVLMKHFKVYLVDSRNHGKSSMTHVFKYEAMRDDIISFIHDLDIKKPHVLGFSDGAIIAKLIAIQHPDLLKSIVLLGGNFRPNGISHKELKVIQEKFRNTKNRYDEMMIKGPFIKKNQLRSIMIPTLIVRGSQDVILKHHSKTMKKQIPNSKLVIMHNKNHENYIVHKDDLYEPLMAFYKEFQLF